MGTPLMPKLYIYIEFEIGGLMRISVLGWWANVEGLVLAYIPGECDRRPFCADGEYLCSSVR